MIKNKKAIAIKFGTFEFEKFGLSYFYVDFNNNDTISFNEHKDLSEIGVLLPFSISQENDKLCTAITERWRCYEKYEKLTIHSNLAYNNMWHNVNKFFISNKLHTSLLAYW